jgi:hypothetical protein
MAEQPTREQIEEITEALAAGRKIEAIKVYREATGKGLKEAKDFIDALIPRLREQDPEKYAKLPVSQRSGCTSAVLFWAGFAVATVVWMLSP